MLVQGSSASLVHPDMLIDAFMADDGALIVRIDVHASGDLFRGKIQTQQPFNVSDVLRRHFDGLVCGFSSLVGMTLRLFGAVASQAGVSGKFPADGAGMDAQTAGDVFLGCSGLLHGVNVDTILFGELSILSHKRSS